MNITITGSRDIDCSDNIKIIRVLKRYIGYGHKWFIGGASGVDDVSLIYLLSCKECVTVVVPFKVSSQPYHCRKRILMATKVKELKLNEPNTGYCYILRNRYMVDRSELVVAFKKGETRGTNSCIKYAEDNGLKVNINYL